jgi:hypothetical protein
MTVKSALQVLPGGGVQSEGNGRGSAKVQRRHTFAEIILKKIGKFGEIQGT